MKKFFNKLIKSVSVFAVLSLLCTMLFSMNSYADETKKITIHFTRNDSKYNNYIINIWTETVHGKDFEFTVEDNKAFVAYDYPSDSQVVSFEVKERNTGKIVTEATVDVADISDTDYDIYIKTGVKGYSTTEDKQEQKSETTVNNTNETVNNDSSEAVTEVKATEKHQDSKDAYKVNAPAVIIIDILFIAVVASVLFIVLKKKN